MEQESRRQSTGSEALQVFQTHADNIGYLLRVISSDTEQLYDPLDAANRMTSHTAAALRNLQKSSPIVTLALAQVSNNLGVIKKDIDEVGAILLANVQVHPFLFDWILVMMVTFAEAYLENILLLLTAAYPAWMKTKDPVRVSGADVLAIEATLDAEKRWQGLMALLRKRWVKQFLSDSPGKWIARLEKQGAFGYRVGLAEEMKTVWDRRHAIVHAPPAARSDQVTGWSGSALATLVQSRSEFCDAISVIDSFVETTDAFAVGVLNAQRLS